MQDITAFVVKDFQVHPDRLGLYCSVNGQNMKLDRVSASSANTALQNQHDINQQSHSTQPVLSQPVYRTTTYGGKLSFHNNNHTAFSVDSTII
jgi:hypothetical protein